MATIVVFASSFSLATLLVLIKVIDLKRKKKNALFQLISKLESKAEELVSVAKFKSLQLIQSIRYIVLVEVRKFAENLFHKTHEKILNEYKIRQNIIMGHKDIVSNGSASFYLKKITEHKGNGEKGKIDDCL